MTAVGREPANAVVMDAETRSAWRGGVGRGASHPTPACALGAVLQLDALRLQPVTDAVGLGEVPSLTRLIAGVDFLGSQRSEEYTSELQLLMRISYAVFGLKKKIVSTHESILPNT